MDPQTLHATRGGVLALAGKQHGVVTRSQLLSLGLHPDAITHRLASGRLYAIRRGVYAVGRPDLGRRGVWMAAVLSCGPRAALSHTTGATLRRIGEFQGRDITISVPSSVFRQPRPGLRIYRRTDLERHTTTVDGLPVVDPVYLILDLAAVLSRPALERAVNEADKRDLITPHVLRDALEHVPRRAGVAALRSILDRHAFVLTDSELERRFLPLARRAGLVSPQTGAYVNGYRVDFFWPETGLVVETDGLRYHRTPGQQARDRLRDQTHLAAGLTPLRFTYAQVASEPAYVVETLRAVMQGLVG